MMELASPAKLVGKLVKDEWGQQIGMVVSVLANGNGEMTWLLVRMGDGRVRRVRLSDIVAVDSGVVVRSGLKKRVESLRRRLALLTREGTLMLSLGTGVSGEALKEISRDLDRSLSMIRAEAEYLLKKIENACNRCTDQIKDIQKGMACLEIEHEMGNVSDEVYGLCMKMMTTDLKKLMAERDDLMKLKEELTRLLEEKASIKVPEGGEAGEEGPINVEVEGDAEDLRAGS